MAAPLMHVYYTHGRKNQRVSEAFAQGSGASLVNANDGWQGGDVAIYGWTNGMWAIAHDAWNHKRDVWYIDNAYIGRQKYFRVTKNAKQVSRLDQGVAPNFGRLAATGLQLRDWRPPDRSWYVLVCLQSRMWHQHWCGMTDIAWGEHVARALWLHTRREIVVRIKESPTSLSESLKGCWAVVTHTSNCAVDAIAAGVPAFTMAQCAASPLSKSFIADIEHPIYPTMKERNNWAAWLASNQWTLDEMRSGLCWKHLTELQQAA